MTKQIETAPAQTYQLIDEGHGMTLCGETAEGEAGSIRYQRSGFGKSDQFFQSGASSISLFLEMSVLEDRVHGYSRVNTDFFLISPVGHGLQEELLEIIWSYQTGRELGEALLRHSARHQVIPFIFTEIHSA